jgi:DNA-binding CsgD family transcriptional regulator
VLTLRDRLDERQALDRLLQAIRTGESRALVISGAAGIGKTVLLDYAAEQASGFRVIRAAGVQTEQELAYAGVHQVCAPVLDRVGRLPIPQQRALRAALGLGDESPADRFFVGLAVLGLLAEAARRGPLVCLVDDAQWLDRTSAETLGFVARRLRAESVAMVLAVRDEVDSRPFAGLPEMSIRGLPDSDARVLLSSVLLAPLDQSIVERIVSEARGNPLALVELPRAFTPAQLAGGFGTDEAGVVSSIAESYERQLARLPENTRRLLTVASLEPTGDPVLVWSAAERLGIPPDAAVPAAAASLVEFGARVRFRHPLLRAAVRLSASADDRRRAYRALAEVADPQADPDRRAWYLAQAVTTTDQGVAAELEASAARAWSRGGFAASAAFLQRAAELTPDPAQRADRALAAAQAAHQAGAADTALALAAVAEAGPPNQSRQAHIDLLRAQVSLTVSRGGDAVSLLLTAAKELEPLDVRLSRDTYLDALTAAMFAGDLATDSGLLDAARAVRSAPAAPAPPRPADLLLDGLATRFTEGYAAALPLLKRAVRAFSARTPPADELRWLWLVCVVAGNLWDEETLKATRHLQLARDTGALATLPLALATTMGVGVLSGDLASAEMLLDEMEAASEATGIPVAPYGALLLTAWRGQEDATLELAATASADVRRRGEGFGLVIVEVAQAVLCNSLGRYDDAVIWARRAAAHPPLMAVEPWGALVELVEAASRSGRSDEAADALRRLHDITSVAGTDWALGMESRCLALLAAPGAAESAYREAIDRLQRTAIRGELARAHLLYGEWLRRQNRRVDARGQLHTAHEMFTTMGMEAFAERTAQELIATGETVRKRSVDTAASLTAQEAQVARMAGDGLSNAEIGLRLFISPRTVEWHLGKVFSKLAINSRRQLRR